MLARAFIVDPDPTTVDQLMSMLTANNFEVHFFRDPSELLPLIAKKEPIHVLITELDMTPIDGFELIAKIREHYPAIPVIGITQLKDYGHEQFAQNDGKNRLLPDRTLAKPLFSDEVFEVINHLSNQFQFHQQKEAP